MHSRECGHEATYMRIRHQLQDLSEELRCHQDMYLGATNKDHIRSARGSARKHVIH